MKMQSIFGVSVFRYSGVSGDSIKNQGVFDTHDFSWKIVNSGGFA